jgi:branched-chain amino acid transport system ATP-binding protein
LCHVGLELEVDSLTVSYGPVVAVNDVTLSVPKGAIVGLIGPNGAGKTTLVDAISGFIKYSGEVKLAGLDLSRFGVTERARKGLSRTFQSGELWQELTVLENIRVGEHSGRRARKATTNDAGAVRVFEPDSYGILESLGLENLAEVAVDQTSQGQQRLISIARALASGPNVVLLDEPAAGLDSVETAVLSTRLRAIGDGGTSLLLIDHDMSLVLNICDYVYVLDFGSIIASGTPQQVRTNPLVIEAYLGASDVQEETTS